MLTEAMWCLGEVLTLTRVVTHHVLGGAVGLGSHTGFTLGQQLHIAIEDDGDRLVVG